MPVGQSVLTTNHKHSNSSENMKIDKVTMTLVITTTNIMKWRVNDTIFSSVYK